MNANDYQVSFGFRATDGEYYGPNGSVASYHFGEDRAMPMHTPIVISNTLIGYSGNTGLSSGPHLHIDKNPTYPGKFAFYVNPSGWPNIRGKVVFSGALGTAGNCVIVQSDGFYYRFLHMNNISVKVGNVIGEDNMSKMGTEELDMLSRAFFGYPADSEFIKVWTGTESNTMIRWFDANPAHAERLVYIKKLEQSQVSSKYEVAPQLWVEKQ